MLFAQGEVTFTTTGESQDESHARAFPIWGVGGGARATLRVTRRVSWFAQGAVSTLAADVPHDALTVLGFREAESVNPAFGGRVGVEWLQVDRHLALCAAVGARVAEGFAKVTAASDFPLMWDTGVGLRYAF